MEFVVSKPTPASMRPLACVIICFTVYIDACACSCAAPPPPSAEFFARYDLVFLGKVVSVKRVRDRDGELDGFVAVFSVSNWIVPKKHNATVSIYTSHPDGMCGQQFKVGETWLMATDYDRLGTMGSSICDGSIRKENKNDHAFDNTVDYFRKLASFTGPLRDTYKTLEKSITIIGSLKNGAPHGQWLKTSGTDTLAIWNFNEGQRNGYEMTRQKGYREDLVNIVYYAVYENEVSVYNQRNQLTERYHVVNGVRHGKYTAYSSDGIWLTLYYIQGRIEGLLVRWNLDENDPLIKTTYLFRNDRMVRKEELWEEE